MSIASLLCRQLLVGGRRYITLSNALSFVFYYIVFLIALCLWRLMLNQRKDLFRPFPLWKYGQAELHIGNINTREEIGMAQREIQEVAPCFWDEKSKLQWLVFSIFSKQVRSTAKELFDFFLFAKISSFGRTQRENCPFVQDAPLQSPKQLFHLNVGKDTASLPTLKRMMFRAIYYFASWYHLPAP